MGLRPAVGLAFTVLLFSGCDSADDRAGRLSYAYMQTTCGPADGAAFEVFVTEARFGCGRLPQPAYQRPADETVLKIWIIGIAEPEVPSTYRFDSSEMELEGLWATWCRQGSECVEVTGGVVTFSATGADTTIAAELTFEGGIEKELTLPVRRCERIVLCG